MTWGHGERGFLNLSKSTCAPPLAQRAPCTIEYFDRLNPLEGLGALCQRMISTCKQRLFASNIVNAKPFPISLKAAVHPSACFGLPS